MIIFDGYGHETQPDYRYNIHIDFSSHFTTSNNEPESHNNLMPLSSELNHRYDIYNRTQNKTKNLVYHHICPPPHQKLFVVK